MKSLFLSSLASAQFTVPDPDIVTSASDCFTKCLSSSAGKFCQNFGDIYSGYCCDGQDCSAYAQKFGFCSDEAANSILRLQSCPFELKKCQAKGTFRGNKENQIQLSAASTLEYLQPSDRLYNNDICYFEISAGVTGEPLQPEVDDYITLTIDTLTKVYVEVAIASDKRSDYIDVCNL